MANATDKKKDNGAAEMRELPHSLNTERLVLSTIAKRPVMAAMLADRLDDDLFYYVREKAVFKSVMALAADAVAAAADGKEILMEATAIADHAAGKDYGYAPSMSEVEEATSMAPDENAVLDAVERLRLMSCRRRAWTMMQEMSKACIDPMADLGATMSDAITRMNDLHRSLAHDTIQDFRAAMRELTAIVEENRSGRTRSLPTGFRLFDEKHLLRPGTLTVIAAFTSVGKSALALNIAVNVAKKGNAVAYYSLEMGKAELAARAISPFTGIPASKIANEQLSDAGYHNYMEKAPMIEGYPIYIDERSVVSFDATVRSIRMMAKAKGVRLAVIDYLQIYSQTGDNAEASLGEMARAAKNVAVETGAAVVLLSQLNRSSSTPSLKMLRGSGQIEESADNVVLIDRPGAYPDGPDKFTSGRYKGRDATGMASFVLAKGRGVGTDETLVRFAPDITLFADTAPQEETGGEEDDDLPF